jgi:hypothetical protein
MQVQNAPYLGALIAYPLHLGLIRHLLLEYPHFPNPY